MNVFQDKYLVITGGTGSLGKTLVRHLLAGTYGTPRKIIIFSRDEAKQHYMRVAYSTVKNPTDEIIYDNFRRLLEFRIGDVRNYASLCSVLRGADIVINAAALKQVPSCEYFPVEAAMTNVIGASNIVRAISENDLPVETVVGVSTDKACLPVNAMGMTKALQERMFIAANVTTPKTRFICVRYGNVLASRGSVIPLFHEQILAGGPVTITTEDMTRFLLPLSHAVTTIATAVAGAAPGETYVPKIAAALITDIAKALIGDRDIPVKVIGIRPGEKVHELMIAPEEGVRAYDRGDFYAIKPMLPELASLRKETDAPRGRSYGSNDDVMDFAGTLALLQKYKLMVGDVRDDSDEELLS
ncbi:UDP-glucose 4-epimerase [uncultured delta proteobacterium]|uniref:UDP-glucose 4-epimerase n=1 Tax=uncultured delta proteobacterium TaxID=34034 RepID=A0A212KH15_9DELT|nr:UDP-glucose 4-epimerase [uncultured delta proteobacterium]